METRLARFMAILVLLWAQLTGVARAGAVSVWSPAPFAPQVVMQDDVSAQIYYSRCNSNSSTIFPNDNTTFLDIDTHLLPRENTSLAGVGWWSEEGNWGAVHYQTKQGDIVHSLWQCNATGYFISRGQWIVSDVAPSVQLGTGLAAVLLGEEDGFRIYYQDANDATCALSYSGRQGVWKYDGIISQDAAQGSALGAASTTPEDIHVVRARGQNIEVATLHNNVTWTLSTFPTPLKNVTSIFNNSTPVSSAPSNSTESADFALNTTTVAEWDLEAWDGNATSLAYTVDPDGIPSVFYIGNDAKIHQVREINGAWSIAPSQRESVWPTADKKNGDFGSAYSIQTGETWLYYMSGGNMVAAYRSFDSEWKDASVLEKVNATADSSSQDGQDGELSIGAKAGIGVGVGLAVVAILGLVVFLVILRRHRARADEEKQHGGVAAKRSHKPMFDHDGTQPSVAQVTQQQPYVPQWEQSSNELANQEYSHELMAQGNYVEMEARRAELSGDDNFRTAK